jgi:PAS domain S-box-containing protein
MVLQFDYILLLLIGFVIGVLLTFLFKKHFTPKPVKKGFNILSKEEQLDLFLDTMHDHMYLKDVKSRFILANSRLVRDHGFKSMDDMVGKTDFDYYPKEMADGFFKDEQKILQTGEPLINKVEENLDEEKNISFMSTSKFPLYDSNGTIVGIVGISRDITQLIQVEKQLKSANEELKHLLDVRNKFFSILAHDLKNPVNLLNGYSDLLVRMYGYLDEQKMRNYLVSIHNTSTHLTNLLENLLQWSILQFGGLRCTPQDMQLVSYIQDVVHELSELAEQKLISVLFREEDKDIMVNCDKHMAHFILRNILTNSIKFSPRGASVKISYKKNDKYVEICVEDNGLGIDKETLDSLFEFDTSKSSSGTEGETGTGLGLLLCKEFIELNGGQISCQSQIGQGSRFYFSLRLSEV